MTEQKPSDVIILGGGLAGLSAALVLAESGRQVTVLEAQEELGGRFRSHHYSGNSFPMGVSLIPKHVPNTIPGLAAVEIAEEHSERFFARGVKFPFPMSWKSLRSSLPLGPGMASSMGMGFANLTNQMGSKPPKSAEHAFKQLYGTSLTKAWFAKRTVELFGEEPAQLSASVLAAMSSFLVPIENLKPRIEAMGVKIPQTWEADLPSASRETTAVFFPEGTGALPAALANAIQKKGGRLICNAEVTAIDAESGQIRAVQCRDTISDPENPEDHLLPCHAALSTIPLRPLIKAIGKGAPAQIHASSLHMRYQGKVTYALLLKRERCLEEVALRFADQPFFRLSEPKIAGQTIHPADHTILLAEASASPGTGAWNGEEKAWIEVLDALHGLGFCQREEIVARHHLREASGYPIYRREFEEHRDRIASFFAKFRNFESGGPSGTFALATPEAALEMGIAAAESLLAKAE